MCFNCREPLTAEDRMSAQYIFEASCPYCADRKKKRYHAADLGRVGGGVDRFGPGGDGGDEDQEAPPATIKRGAATVEGAVVVEGAAALDDEAASDSTAAEASGQAVGSHGAVAWQHPPSVTAKEHEPAFKKPNC